MFIMRRKLRERGDTLVEVLIAMALISMVLGGAYVTTNKALQSTRDAQERTAGLKLVEAQFEQLRSVAASDPTTLFGGSATVTPYCMVDGATASGATCIMDASGSSTGTAQPKYKLAVTHPSGQPNTFTVTETWPGINGTNETIQMQYRLYQAP